MWEFVTSVIVAALTGYFTFRVQEERLKKELKTEFMAEKVAKDLLSNERWTKRSFEEIKKRLGGVEDDELRKILVRAGAVRFEGVHGKEFWGLLNKNGPRCKILTNGCCRAFDAGTTFPPLGGYNPAQNRVLGK